ncbi:MAG TPA: BTAD domain-containing putative transcriptional regulator, partial [Acidimicrobiales bacterium]|nr:BTAD domain-containing putative transcriptional regulator [Acidimicrobiales bacterium]
GRMVPAGDLVVALWGDDPPASAAKSLQTFVVRLRNALEVDRLRAPTMLLTEGPGYRLALDQGQVDAEQFARLAVMGRRALAEGRADSASRTLTEALTLWRGPAYAGFDADFAHAESRRLDELRLGATEDRLAADLALGRAGESVPELERLVADHPMRERLWEMLVTALYRAGRQGDALGAYERARALLADELGVDPGPGLRAVHARVLAHDPTLGLPTTSRGALPPELRATGQFVGRAVELARLRDAWQRAVRGRAATVVVRGPAGAGASALAAAFATEAARDGATVRFAARGTPTALRTAGDGPGTAPLLLVLDHVDGPGRLADGEDEESGATLTLRLTGHLAAVPAGAEVLDLTPLSVLEVREVVAEHVPPGEVDGVTDEVLSRSGGWPGAVHDAAADVARARARRQVEAAVAISGSSSTDLAAARADIADGVASLADLAPHASTHDTDQCPWRGLAAYDVDDARWYAGRERLVAEVVARMPGSRLLALVGASGSGKSSLMRAGLMAALRRDVLPGSATWRVVTLRPGPHPMAELARRALGRAGTGEVGDLLRHLVEGGRDTDDCVVLAVDQLEEAWTVCRDDAERRQFLDALADLATDPRSAVTVVVAVRADYLSELADHDELRALVGAGTVLVGPLTPAEIRRAVERPAATARLTLDDGLADTIVSDAGQEPGLLPLLSTAMAQLWERRENGSLSYPAYVGLGGLNGAIATLAEQAYAGLSPTQQATARTLLLRLTGPGDGAGVTRRRVTASELEALPTQGVGPVVEDLARARLLTVADGTVEVAHEALFREWPRLRGWLVEDAAGRAVQRRLAVAAAEWDADGREASALWTGTRLASGLEVAGSRPDEVTSTERAFLDASRDAVDAQQRAAEERARTTARQNRRLRWLVAGIGVVLVAALVAGTAAWRSQRTAQAASVSAEAKRLAASALNIEYPDVALLAAVEATKLEQSPETYGALLTLLARQPRVVHRMRVEDHFQRIGVSPDGRTIYLSEVAPRLRAVDAESGRVLWDRDMPQNGQVGNITPTADGTGIVVTEYSEDPGIVRLDAATGQVVWAARAGDLEQAAPGAAPWVMRGGLTSDGRYVVTTDSHVFTLDVGSGAVSAATAWPEPLPFTPYVVVWPDGRVSRDTPDDTATGLVFDAGHPERGAVEVDGIPRSVSPDGTRVVLVREIDGATDLRVARSDDLGETSPWVRMPAHVNGASWSPDGARLVITTDDGIQLLDPVTLRLGTRSVGHSGEVVDARFAGPASDLVWTAGRDGTAVAFDLSGQRTQLATRAADPQPHVGAS